MFWHAVVPVQLLDARRLRCPACTPGERDTSLGNGKSSAPAPRDTQERVLRGAEPGVVSVGKAGRPERMQVAG